MPAPPKDASSTRPGSIIGVPGWSSQSTSTRAIMNLLGCARSARILLVSANSCDIVGANEGWRIHMSAITLKVNGRAHTLDLDPTTPLLYALSDDLELRGPKFGCGLGQCGACTVIVKGEAIRSCVTPVKDVEGAEITTLEGLGTPEKPHPIQKAFIDEQAAQCGFCLNGVIMTAKAFIDKNPKATETQIEQALSGVLCRCFTNVRMLRAIERYGK